jgi:ATP synthase protein I
VSPNKLDHSQWRSIGLAISIPAMMGASAVVGALIGFFLDKWLGTGPWLLLVFLVLGLLTGLRETIVLINRMNRDQ